MGEFLPALQASGSATSMVNFAHQAMPSLPSATAIGAEIEGTFAKKDVNGANSASYMNYPNLLDGKHSAARRHEKTPAAPSSRIHGPHHSRNCFAPAVFSSPPPSTAGRRARVPAEHEDDEQID